MKKHTLIIVASAILLVSAPASFGQGGGLIISAGVASVRMDDMKELQEYLLSTYPLEGKTTSSFPPYTSFSISLFKQLYDHIRIGGVYTFSTTGGKSSYSDYSGIIATEITATANRLGAYLSYFLLGGEHLELSMYGKVDANLTSLAVDTYYTILNYSNGNTNKYRSLSPSGTIGAELMYDFGIFGLGLDAGYLVDLGGNLNATTDGEPLLDPYDRENTLRADWTGWNVHLTALIRLKH